MAKKQDSFYFETFITCMDYACQAAQLLNRVMSGYAPQQIKQELDEMHALEHAAGMWSLFCLQQNTAFWRSRPERWRCAKG